MADELIVSDHADAIEDAPMSSVLHGAVIDYQYSTGNHYRLNFAHDYHVGFELLSEVGKEDMHPIEGPLLAYRERILRHDLIQIGWIVKDANIHVTITVDIAAKKMYVSAMMPPNKWEFWDSGEIFSITWP